MLNTQRGIDIASECKIQNKSIDIPYGVHSETSSFGTIWTLNIWHEAHTNWDRMSVHDAVSVKLSCSSLYTQSEIGGTDPFSMENPLASHLFTKNVQRVYSVRRFAKIYSLLTRGLCRGTYPFWVILPGYSLDFGGIAHHISSYS